MKTYLALTALLCSLASAVDILDDDLLDNDDETSAGTVKPSVYHNGFIYTYNEDNKHWKDAKGLCKAEGGNLLSIRSDDELEAILPLIPFRSNGLRHEIHIALKNRGPDYVNADWEWVDSDDKYSESEAEDLEWVTG